jgi:hypothetical protein
MKFRGLKKILEDIKEKKMEEKKISFIFFSFIFFSKIILLVPRLGHH